MVMLRSWYPPGTASIAVFSLVLIAALVRNCIAAVALMIPAPFSNGCPLMFCALPEIMSLISAAVMFGFDSRSCAMTPVTIGDENDVPDAGLNSAFEQSPDGLFGQRDVGGAEALIDVPGAVTVGPKRPNAIGPLLLNDAMVSSETSSVLLSSDAATDRIPRATAGDAMDSVSGPVFDAEATKVIPNASTAAVLTMPVASNPSSGVTELPNDAWIILARCAMA